MHQLLVCSLGSELNVIVDRLGNLIEPLIGSHFWYEFIPGVQVSQNVPTVASVPSVEIMLGKQFSYNVQKGTITITSERDIYAAIVAVGYILERQRQEMNMFTIHGNVIQHGDTSYAILGGVSGLGKTTLSAYASLHSWGWLSDEKFVIDSNGMAIGATKDILTDSKTGLAAGIARPIGIKQPHSLSGFIYAIVTSETVATAYHYTLDKASWHIYEEMSRDIRIANSISPGITPLPSFDSTIASENRWNTAQELAGAVPCYFIRGDENSILSAIDSIFTKTK